MEEGAQSSNVVKPPYPKCRQLVWTIAAMCTAGIFIAKGYGDVWCQPSFTGALGAMLLQAVCKVKVLHLRRLKAATMRTTPVREAKSKMSIRNLKGASRCPTGPRTRRAAEPAPPSSSGIAAGRPRSCARTFAGCRWVTAQRSWVTARRNRRRAQKGA